MSFDVIHVVASLNPRQGGPSKSVLALAVAQAEAGARVALATVDARPPGAVPTACRLFVGRPTAPNRLCCSRELREFLDTTPTRIVHHHGLWTRPLHYAHAATRRSGAKLVVSPRGMLEPWAWRHHRAHKWFAARFVHPGAFAAAAGWHATSESEAVHFVPHIDGAPICTAPNGVNLPTTVELATARHHWHAQFPTLTSRRVALFYSRFHSKKRVGELIDLWAAQPRGDWLLLVAGIPEEYSVADLEHRVQRLGAADRILVVSGLDHPPPYAAAELTLLPTHSENFGLVVAEGLAAGLPALVTDTAPWQVLNTDGGGWCVPWSDFPAVLAQAVAESPAALAARGRAGRALAATTFTWPASATQLLRFYDRLTSSGDGI